jgi:UDP-N-acetylglucosamine--N-acetylmuramyl-(pentapeptide) pyrophosphoryl-undecaprenol N-acetylglucosamine transferase
MRILIFMCGEGLGHTSRCLALGKECLASEDEVFFGAYGYSKDLIVKVGYTAYEIPSEIKLVGKAGSFDFKSSIEATLKNAKLLGGPMLLKLTKNLKPDVVVSDSYYMGILAARALKIPVYLIINQSNMEDFFKSRCVPIRILGELTKKLYNHTFKKVDKIIIPDYPLPYTVCRKNLGFTPKVRGKLFYSGPLVREKYDEVEGITLKKPHVISLIGGFGYREPIFEKVLETAKLDPTIYYTLISGPTLNASKFTDLPENVEILRFIKDAFPYFKSADVVIAPGGHSTMMEALSFGIPILSFPDEGHNEQQSNAAVVEEEGYGRKLSYLTRPEVILECIREVLEDKSYREKTERLRRLAGELNGPKAIRDMLKTEIEAKSSGASNSS